MKSRHMVLLVIPFCSLHGRTEGVEKHHDFRPLHRRAETALTQRNYPSAEENYLLLLSQIQSPRSHDPRKQTVDWNTYIDHVLRLGEIYRAQANFDAGIQLLGELLQQDPPEDYIPKITFLKARHLCGKKRREKLTKKCCLLPKNALSRH